jgi:hypothetical protein
VFSYQMAFLSAAIIALIGFIIQGLLLFVFIPRSLMVLPSSHVTDHT